MKRAIFILVFALLVWAPSAQAAQSSFLPNCDQTMYHTSNGKDVLAQDYTTDMGQIEVVYTSRDCGLDDFVQLFINLADWGLTIIAVATLFFFGWGAWQWIIAGGRQGMIDDGKKKMTGAITGLIIVLVAWVLVGFYIGALTGNFKGYVFPGSDSQRLWFGNKSSCKNTYTTLCRVSDTTTIKDGCGDPAATEFGEIAQIQKRLTEQRCDVGKTDGCYGPQTAAAVKTFQEANGLTATGEIDEETFLKIMSGGFPCGFDGFIPTPGCCIPKRTTPNANQQCINNILQTSCTGKFFGSPAVEYYFKSGNCSSQDCSSNIIDLSDLPTIP